MADCIKSKVCSCSDNLLSRLALIWQRLFGGSEGRRDSLFRAAADESTEALLLTAADGNFVYVNNAFHKLFPKSEGEAATSRS